MRDADAIWESKMRRLEDPNLEKMEPLVGLMESRGRGGNRGVSPGPMPLALRRAPAAVLVAQDVR
jgi:hypothetical protein